eukprot:RCo054159
MIPLLWLLLRLFIVAFFSLWNSEEWAQPLCLCLSVDGVIAGWEHRMLRKIGGLGWGEMVYFRSLPSSRFYRPLCPLPPRTSSGFALCSRVALSEGGVIFVQKK